MQDRIARAYRGQDFDGAAAIARRAATEATGAERRDLEQTATQIDSFASMYPRIHAAGEAVGPVARQISIAIALDGQIVPGGHFRRELAPPYVRWLVSQARSQIGTAPAAACANVRSAITLDASNADARGLAAQCETAASRLLTDARGREVRDPAGARRAYADIQRMVPRTSSAFTTAQERLAAMGRARPVDEDE